MIIFVIQYRLSPSYRKTLVTTVKGWTKEDAKIRLFKKLSLKHKGHIQIVDIFQEKEK